MKPGDINDRFRYIYGFITLVCVLIILRILYLGIVEKENYKSVAEESIYKDITIPAPRGEIRDKNGILLAGNKPIFTVTILKNEIDSSVSSVKERKLKINAVSKKISDILKNNNENIQDNFPINISNDSYTFIFDEDIKKWKKENNIDENMNAKDAFYKIKDNFVKQTGTVIDSNASVFEIQKILNENGIYPPISVTGDMEYTRALDKEQWLGNYGIKDTKISAKDAFAKVRNNRLIDEKLTDEQARDVLVIVDAMLSKKYLQYEPALISRDISQKTVAIIEENIVELDGVNVQVQPLRYYPQGNLASHILGQIGKISSSDESYLKDERYSKSDYVGKSGIEFAFEKYLKGTNGYERVLVDSAGKKIKDIESKESTSGNTVYLSIDAKLQKVAETSLEKTLKTLQVGGTYDSKWGDMKMRGATKVYKNANAGAIVALDIKTGKVLAMASYPSYDPNMFTDGLTQEQLKSLEPENPNDPLSPKPMFNAATMTAVQPGSVFKMITALAGLENGLDPYYSIEDKGFIEIGGVPFGNWLWNQERRTQGFENVVTALRDSNNYYFYCISVGYNYATDKKIPMGDMKNGTTILDMARKFGLDKKTGLEIYELSGKIPDPKTKYLQQQQYMKRDITSKMANYFKDINAQANEKQYEERINTIISWTDENPSRAEIIKRLANLNVRSEKLEEIADLLKYTYFNHANWTTGDIFNMAIGQGEHQYTPVQIANYISAIANNGYLNKVSLVDKLVEKQTGIQSVVEPEREKIDISNAQNYYYIQHGMIDVSDEGTAKDIFAKFPIKVAAKTGTAETQGKIPTKDEVAYYMSHLDYYNVNKDEVLALSAKLKENSTFKYKDEYYLKSAILSLNRSLTINDLDTFKETYGDYSWFVAYAPYDKPEIAVVTLLFQGGSGGHAGPATRDVIAQYMGLNNEEVQLNDEKDDLKIKVEQDQSNTQKKTYNYEDKYTQNQSNYVQQSPNPSYTPSIEEKPKVVNNQNNDTQVQEQKNNNIVNTPSDSNESNNTSEQKNNPPPVNQDITPPPEPKEDDSSSDKSYDGDGNGDDNSNGDSVIF